MTTYTYYNNTFTTNVVVLTSSMVIQHQKWNPVEYLVYETNSRLQEPSHLLRSSEYDSVCYWCWAMASRYYIPSMYLEMTIAHFRVGAVKI